MNIKNLFDWVRINQPDGKLTQAQVDAVDIMLLTMPLSLVQSTLSKLNGWVIPNVSGMSLSSKGSELIKQYEAFVSHPYKDAVGKWTIGYGNTYYPGGRKVTANDKHLTEPEGDKLKQAVIDLDFGPAVNKIFADQIATGKINQNQFDALMSLAYNIGTGALSRSNSVTGNIKAGRMQQAADGFLKFNNGTVNGKFGPINGLTNRRRKERALFLA